MQEKITDLVLSLKLSNEIQESYITGLEFITANPDYALQKFREIVEMLVSMLEKKNHLELVTKNLQERIKNLSVCQIISNPLQNQLHEIRKLGNKAVHYSNENSNGGSFIKERKQILTEKAFEARKCLISAFENVYFSIYGCIAAKETEAVAAGQQEFKDLIYSALMTDCYKTKLNAGVMCESIYNEIYADSPLIVSESLALQLKGIENHAIQFYDSACSMSANFDLQFRLGSDLKDKEKIIQNKSDVEALFRFASLSLGKEGLIDKTLSLNRLKSSAERGFVPAQAFLGTYYYAEGEYSHAISYLIKAGDQEEPLALRYLFYYYSEGKACDTNIEKALSFLLRGMELGNADCEALLGIEYHKGSLVDKNDIKARELLEKSIIAGSIIGKNYMILHFNNLAKKVAGEASKFGESLLKIIEERKPKPFRAEGKIPPNSLCPCGSKLKYKKCCKNGVSKKGSEIHLPWI
ncbi:DUF4145 domain-containing protein [Pseudoalteromonas sp. PA2MD11]|uniref:DUF4145 domain-containing protein n=1 Tax=Pseudoalteromonas sp. PA2MD11 TaxID=2785057 RepID=UPI001ADED15C|nr:DUF4145 domain-containing protein [Pseudoalteromonas sp. PA2MD11]